MDTRKNEKGAISFAKASNVIAVISALFVIGIAVLLNFFFGKLPSSFTTIDLSEGGLYSISAETEEVLSALNRETTIYWIVESGNENTQTEYLLERYKELSSFISTEKIDPIVYPDFASEYTSSDLNDNSLLVVQGTKGRFIDYYDLFTADYGTYGDGIVDTVFDGENLLTSAISTLMNNYENIVYVISGHDETELSDTLVSLLERENYNLKDLRLLSQGGIPSDADVVILADPQKDLSQAEGKMLSEYLDNGGNLLVFIAYNESETPVLEGVLSRYGMEKSHGIVLEGDSSMYYSTYQMYLLPKLKSHEITNALASGGYYILTPICDGLVMSNNSSSDCEIGVLLESSSNSYSKPEGYNITTVAKEDGDTNGPFVIAAAITEKTAAGEGRAVWFASSRSLYEDVDKIVSGANSELVVNSMGWLADRELSLNIRSKNLTSGKLVISGSAKTKYGIILLGVIPAILVAAGIIIHIRRRRK